MKLKQIRIKKYKLLRFYLAKYEAYIKDCSSFVASDKILDRLELSFKKALFIIYQYHIYNKLILFVGVPYSSDKRFLKVLKSSNHVFLPKSIWKKGLIGNKVSLVKKSKDFFFLKRIADLKDNPHLIVLFNEDKSNNLILEASRLCIPIVCFGDIEDDFEGKLYLVKGRFIKNKMKNFFQFLIYSILKLPKNKEHFYAVNGNNFIKK